MYPATHVAIANEINGYDLVGYYVGSMLPEVGRDSTVEIDIAQVANLRASVDLTRLVSGLGGGVALHTKTERVVAQNEIFQGLTADLTSDLTSVLPVSLAPLVSRAGIELMIDDSPQTRKNQALAKYHQVIRWLDTHQRVVADASTDPQYMTEQMDIVIIAGLPAPKRPSRFMALELYDRFRHTEAAFPDEAINPIANKFDDHRIKVASASLSLWDSLIADIYNPDI